MNDTILQKRYIGELIDENARLLKVNAYLRRRLFISPLLWIGVGVVITIFLVAVLILPKGC